MIPLSRLTRNLAAATALALLGLAGCQTAAVDPAPAQRLNEAERTAERQAAPIPLRRWTPIRVMAQAVPLSAPAYEGSGPVRFAGGIHLTSPSIELGGISDLALTDDRRFLAITDEGFWLRGELVLDRTGRLTGVRNVAVRPLLDAEGRALALQDKSVSDSEGLAIADDGSALVSFEREHRIWRYDLRTGRSLGAAAMPDVELPLNDGLEGLTFAHGAVWAGGEAGGLWRCTNACEQIAPPPAVVPVDSDQRVTALSPEPDGDRLFVLTRAWDEAARRNTMEVTLRAPSAFNQPHTPLIRLEPPATVDNFEGLSARPRAGGVRLYISSDDNYSPHQRTLILAFDVDQAAMAAPSN